MNKVLLAAVGITGYVLGARAGRERYEKLLKEARHVAHDPRVHDTVRHVAESVRDQAPVMKERLINVASTATHPASHPSTPPDVY